MNAVLLGWGGLGNANGCLVTRASPSRAVESNRLVCRADNIPRLPVYYPWEELPQTFHKLGAEAILGVLQWVRSGPQAQSFLLLYSHQGLVSVVAEREA